MGRGNGLATGRFFISGDGSNKLNGDRLSLPRLSPLLLSPLLCPFSVFSAMLLCIQPVSLHSPSRLFPPPLSLYHILYTLVKDLFCPSLSGFLQPLIHRRPADPKPPRNDGGSVPPGCVDPTSRPASSACSYPLTHTCKAPVKTHQRPELTPSVRKQCRDNRGPLCNLRGQRSRRQ